MSAVGSILGISGGAGGTGFSGPSQANLIAPASQAQADQLYGKNLQALGNQDFFTQQVLGQNGLANQSNVFSQLGNIANGQGPNPAQNMLNQATGANVANQAALMAGQRGSNANVGLIGRQAAMQGANIQQQAIGQNATLQSQQQLNALGAQGNIANQQASQAQSAVQGNTNAAQGLQSNVLNAIGNYNSAQAGVQSSINSANASMANTRMGQQGNMIGNIAGGIGSAFSLAKGGEVPRPMYAEGTTSVVPGSGQYAPIDPNNNPFAPQANPLSPGVPAMAAPIVPAAVQPATAAKGPKSAMGRFMAGATDQTKLDGPSQAGQFIGKAIGTGLKNIFGSSASTDDATPHPDIGVADPNNIMQGAEGFNKEVDAPASEQTDGTMMAANGGKVPAMVSPGEVYLDRKAVKEVAKGKDPIHAGEKIPGKAKVKGNNYANDTVPKTLESGGIVLPKSVMESKHPHWAAHQFVSQIMAKQGKLPKKVK